MILAEFDAWYRTRYNKTSSALTATAIIISDLFSIMLSFGVGFFLVNLYDFEAINFKSFVTYWVYLPIFIIIFQILHLYPGVSLAPSEELRSLMIASYMAHGGMLISRYVEDGDLDAITIALSISSVFSTFILIFFRDLTRNFLNKMNIGNIPAVIFGGGKTGKQIIDHLLANKNASYIPVLILDNDAECGEFYRDIPIIHDTSIGPEIVQQFNIKVAIVAMPNIKEEELNHMLNYSVSAFRYNVLIPSFFNITNIWMSIRDFGGILGFATSQKLKMSWNLAIKRFLDLFIVILGGLIILPMLLFIALLVKLTSKGPILYGHNRLGINGKPFKALKYRSMAADADKRLEELLASDPSIKMEWEASHKLKNDPRITNIGALLRRTSFDEFPQIINVLKGDMSLVGPRPIVNDEVEKYGENFQRIFSVKPGMTGLWQVSGRSDTDYSERVSYDTYYLQSWSIWLDLWILYRTIWVVIKGKGAY